MGSANRLNLLLTEDERLLAINSGLSATRISEASVPKAQEDPQQKESTMQSVPSEEADADADADAPSKVSDEKGEAETKTRVNNPVEVKVAEEDNSIPLTIVASDAKLLSAFCPIVAASRYPYKCIRGDLSQSVATQFFDKGKFWTREWDLHYVLVPPHIHSRPLLVVPALQVQQLLREINAYFDSDFSLLKECPKGFVLEFQDDGTPQPIFLGQISSREAKDYYESQIRNERLTRYLAGKEEKNAFEEKIRDGIDATRNKKKSKVERKQERRHAELDWEICLARVQCYFGLLDSDRERIDKSSEDVMIPLYLPTFNLEQPVSFPMWKTPIFISIDVESNEVAHSQVTEVGISILDTLDLAGVAPGEAGKNWMSRISARHFRVRDYAHIVNTKYVLGCPDRFEFGQSEWVALADLAKEVDACFNYYLAKVMMERDAAPELKERGIIIVGHNVPFDVKYLRNVGSTFLENHEASRIIDTVDTALLFRMWKREQHIRSLGNILTEFDVIPWYLHNAGNDARYTLEAMVHIALKAREGAKEYGAYVEVKYQDRYDIEGEWM